MTRPPARIVAALMALLLSASACQTSDVSAPDSTTTPSSSPSSSSAMAGIGQEFDDRTVETISSVDAFVELARVDGTQSAVKFAIPELSRPGVVWLESSFYELHDEWYWFRLLNGQPVPGLDTAPLDDPELPDFESIDDIYAWASDRPDDLPLDLRFTPDGDRLYSNEYYDLALRDPAKTYGLGTLVRFEVDGRPRWVIETEFGEPTTPESVGQFIDRLAESLPKEIGDELEWVVRSPRHEATALEMAEAQAPHHDRVVRYEDLIAQGEVAVYNPGLTAGRLRLIESDADLVAAASDDILVMASVPDYLPPAAAILTAEPQTPLAHVNLLARNRGIPNVSIGGLLDDPGIAIAARSRAHAVIEATDEDLRITLITEDQYRSWGELEAPPEIAVPPVDITSLETIVSLTDLAAEIDSESDVAALRPAIGGKSAGFLALIGAEDVTVPDSPLGITVAPYFRHLELVEVELGAMLSNEDFRRDVRARYLLLEGLEDYAETYTNERDTTWAEAFSDEHPDGPIRRILDADGFLDLFRSADMNEKDLADVTTTLSAQFGALAETQGLRFRSSSSIEDIEGFSGAGLYDSNTGFLDPELQEDEDDHKKTIERTLKKTWASYWGFEAFEERRLENVDHRSGGMGVLVHPRFDDPLEVDNGVAVLTLLPEDGPDRAVVIINTQLGDVSVTNPDSGSDVLPEQIEVRIADDGSLEIERQSPSSLVDQGDQVLNDADIGELVGQLETVAVLWRARVNADLDAGQQIELLTLDYEFKHMAAGWPAMADGSTRPARLVVKQARSLDPGLRGMPDELLALPIPRDLLARAIHVEQVSCADGSEGIEVTTGNTDSAASTGTVPDFVVLSATTGALDGETCERTTLLSSPERVLIDLLESGQGLDIG